MPHLGLDVDLAYLSATDALSMFRAGTLSPVELLDALIEHIESVEPTVNAVVDRRYDEARAEAKASANRYAGSGSAARPLDGLPVAAKEEHPMVGRAWRQGSHVLADVVADLDHPMDHRSHLARRTGALRGNHGLGGRRHRGRARRRAERLHPGLCSVDDQ